MPRRGPAEDAWEHDDWDDDSFDAADDDDGDDDDDVDDEVLDDDAPRDEDDEEPTIPCPECRRQIHDESQRCPYCGHYLTEEDGASEPKPWWVVLGAILALATVGAWFLF